MHKEGAVKNYGSDTDDLDLPTYIRRVYIISRLRRIHQHPTNSF